MLERTEFELCVVIRNPSQLRKILLRAIFCSAFSLADVTCFAPLQVLQRARLHCLTLSAWHVARCRRTAATLAARR